MPPKPGDILDVVVERLAYGGQGVARIDGFVLFVRGALPGDRVRARVTRRKRGFAEARATELLEPSALRVLPGCARAAECGGCEWQALAYDEQLRIKEEQVVDSLAHIGGQRPATEGHGGRHRAVDEEPRYVLEPIRGMADPWRYRNKMEFSFAQQDARLLVGLHKRGSWREIVEVDDCRLAPEPIERARQVVAQACRALNLRAYERTPGTQPTGLLRHLVVRYGFASGDVVAHLFVARHFPQAAELAELVRASGAVTSLAVTVNDTPADAAVGGPATMLFGPPHFHEALAGLPLRVPLGAFLQTNTAMCATLYETALRFADAQRRDHVFDLYCGIGSLSLLLAARVADVNAIEIQPEAIAAAEDNARMAGVTNVHFHAGDVRKILKEPPAPGRADVVVADPPRAGLSRKALARAAALGARRFVYVSCNPTTLAGNAAELSTMGYRLTRVAPVDMFPHTHHIEVVALFEREQPRGRAEEQVNPARAGNSAEPNRL
jgi:23S rRNA (uracil1939-C5)-methyltransferase